MSDADIVTQALAYARAHLKHGPDFQEALAALTRIEAEVKRLRRDRELGQANSESLQQRLRQAEAEVERLGSTK